VALRVEQQVGGFEVAVDQVSGVQLLQSLEQLLDDVLLVDFLQDVGTDDGVQVSLHLVEDALNVLVVASPDDVQQSHHVFVPVQLL